MHRTSMVRVSGMVRAQDQFCALATGALVCRCGSNSPASHAWSPASMASLREFGMSWVLCVCRDVGITLLPEAVGENGGNKMTKGWCDSGLHVSIGVSLTLGTVYCDCWANWPTARCEALCYIKGVIGGNRMAMSGADTRGDMRVIEAHHRNTVECLPWRGCYCLFECSPHWIVMKTNNELELWKVHNGEIQHPPRVVSNVHFQEEFTLRYLCLKGNILIMWGDNCATAEGNSSTVLFIDLKKTFSDSSLAVIQQWKFPNVYSWNVIPTTPLCTLPNRRRGQTSMEVAIHLSTENTRTHTFDKCDDVLFASDDHIWVVNKGPPITNKCYYIGDLETPIFNKA
ncbi:hypothetical protein Pelo_17681 [Pelomyxa schiedti]|nr:hypothetical protein Pelo_17681 [Pelomyxa schiedti]